LRGAPGVSANSPDLAEVEELERTAAWRLRCVDADPADAISAAAALRLESLAADLRHENYSGLWAELNALCNWFGESDAISDYAELAQEYRARIGASHMPANGGDYLRDLLAIARGLV
jgi:hypothetical protein